MYVRCPAQAASWSYLLGLKMVANASLLYFVGGLVFLCGRSVDSAMGGAVWLEVAASWIPVGRDALCISRSVS